MEEQAGFHMVHVIHTVLVLVVMLVITTNAGFVIKIFSKIHWHIKVSGFCFSTKKFFIFNQLFLTIPSYAFPFSVYS